MVLKELIAIQSVRCAVYCKLLAALLLAAIFLSSLPAARAGTYANPIVTGAADPFITYQNGHYYLLGTSLSNDIRIWSSTSLATLGASAPTSVYNTGEFYESAELYSFNGLWYIYYTQYPNTVKVIESDSNNPLGTYHAKATLTTNTYDASLLQMPGGQVYLMGSTYGNLVIQPMSNPYTVSGGQTTIASIDQPWESTVIEAPQALWRNGQLTILYASGGYNQSNYSEGGLRFNGGSPTSAASYTKLAGPLFTGEPAAGVCDAAVLTPFSSPDGAQTWFCYSDYPTQGAPDSQRSILVQQMAFDTANNPAASKPVPTAVHIALPSGDPNAGSDALVSGGFYSLTNVTNGLVLDDPGSSTALNTQVGLWTPNGTGAQNWRLTLQTDGSFTLYNQAASLVLDDPGSSTALGTIIQLWTPNGSAAQNFALTPQANGSYTLTNKAANLNLDDPNFNGVLGTKIQLWSANGATAQDWYLIRH